MPLASERRLQAGVEGTRPRRAYGTGVGELRAAIGEIGHVTGIEECPVGRIAVVQDVIDPAVELERLVDLVRGVDVENRIAWQPRCLIGFIAGKILAADE